MRVSNHFLYTLFLSLCYFDISHGAYYPALGVSTGINAATGERPARRNIVDVQKDEPTFSLLIQGLIAFQNMDINDPTSFWQLAGLHGRPYISWNNVGETPYKGSNVWPAYCEHSSVLFLTWHRPYLALCEQTIAAQIQTIAARYTGAQGPVYKAAADSWRMSYWDWGFNSTVPDVFNAPTVTITTPDGRKSVPNPLLAYTFPPGQMGSANFPTNDPQDGVYATFPKTLRDPLNGVSRPATVNAVLQTTDYRQWIYDLFTRTTDYLSFSTAQVDAGSIESIHGSIHNQVGGAEGHMAPLSYSAFEPMFLFHHCYVDRIFALWQAIYPDQFIPANGLQNEQGTYTIPYQAIEYSNTPLTPFYSSNEGTFWTSDTARYMKPFGYTYPEINDWSQTPDQLKKSVTARVNAMYGQQSSTQPRSHIPGTAHPRAAYTAPRDIPETKWFIRCKVDKYAVEGRSFLVRFFLGPAPTDPSTWAMAENLAGSMTVLVSNIKLARHLPGSSTMYAEIPISSALVAAGLVNLDIETVSPYLTEHLNWQIQKVDHTVVDVSTMDSLEVSTISDVMIPQTSEDTLPSYTGSTVHLDITKGKLGGAIEAAVNLATGILEVVGGVL